LPAMTSTAVDDQHAPDLTPADLVAEAMERLDALLDIARERFGCDAMPLIYDLLSAARDLDIAYREARRLRSLRT
jgi:hypothetical protein